MEGERRQLTVMFCDLVGSTELSERLDPEELSVVIRAYREVCAEVVAHFDQEIARYLGDGFLVYFGYPSAHEDDPVRGVSAALEILAGLPRLNAEVQEQIPALRDHALEVRIGIHTGLVVAGELSSGRAREADAIVGQTPNLAARLQALAQPNTVVISDATRRLVRGVFVLEDRGPQDLKGIADPVPVYRVLQESGVQSRLELAAAAELIPFVGRKQETALLLDRWEQTQDGIGQVVLLSGEAGMGKSRLVQELRKELGDDPHTWLECQGSSHCESSALHPVIALLEQALHYRREDSPEEKIAKLERELSSMGFELSEAVPLFATLLSISPPERYSPSPLSPEAQRRRTLESLVRWLFVLTQSQPLILAVEDLQWMDPSTLQLVGMILEQAPTVPILVVLTYRTGFEPPWPARSYLAHLSLHPLTRRQTKSMVEGITRGKTLPEEVLAQILVKTDGVPLFVEELTKNILESGLLLERDRHYELLTGPLLEVAIPSTLRDSLMARLDRLGLGKEIAQLASVLGREFSGELLQAVSPLASDALKEAVARLVEVELLYRRGQGSDATYVFRHALVQETAYESLLLSRRREHHRRVAEALAKHFPEVVGAEPEQLARHYTEAGLTEPAIGYWQQAGQQAVGRSANVEAIHHLNRALELLATLPEAPENHERELGIQTLLGVGLIETKGYAAEEVERAFARAQQLCAELGDAPQQFPILVGLFLFRMVRAEREATRELVQPLLAFAERSQDSGFLVEAHAAAGIVAFYERRHAGAEKHWEETFALYDPDQHGGHAFVYGQDPAALAYAYSGVNLWLLGHPDQALERSVRGIALAEKINHPFSLAGAVSQAGDLRLYRGEIAEGYELHDRCVSISAEQSFPLWLGVGTCGRGWALVRRGQMEEGIAQIQEGLAIFRATGAVVDVASNLSRLADALPGLPDECAVAGRAEEGLAAVNEALSLTGKSLDRYFEPELRRLRGELLLILPTPDPVGAESCFQRAVEQSREQAARSLELRAATSLARLWQQQGRKEEAHALLAPVYDWFTEGFDTRDLKDAKVLLDELT
jgi:class 3 adenylate cyclase/predicted ATPase